MNTDSFIALALVMMIVMLFGGVVAFAGYRLFMILLPIWGFFFGFGLGAQAIQALLGDAFLGTVTSWVVGFIVALVFAFLSYLFYFCAVAVLAGAIGYALGVGLLQLIGIDFGLIDWLVGMVVGIIFAVGTLVLNIQKWVIIIGTALLGAGIVLGTFLMLFGSAPPAELTHNPVRVVLQSGPFWILVFLVIAALGAAAQISAGRRQEVEEYNRWNEIAGAA
jgi:hypothetical protein